MLVLVLLLHVLGWHRALRGGVLDPLLWLRSMCVFVIVPVSWMMAELGGVRVVILGSVVMLEAAAQLVDVQRRAKVTGPHPGLKRLQAEWGPRWHIEAIRRLFLPQALLLWLGLQPTWHGIQYGAPLPFGLIDGVALLLVVLGFFLSRWAAATLTTFLREDGGAQGICRRGPWAHCRHPDRVGVLVFAWGIYGIAAAAGDGGWALLGTLGTTFWMFWRGGGRSRERSIAERRLLYGEYRMATGRWLPGLGVQGVHHILPTEVLRQMDAPTDPNARLPQRRR